MLLHGKFVGTYDEDDETNSNELLHVPFRKCPLYWIVNIYANIASAFGSSRWGYFTSSWDTRQWNRKREFLGKLCSLKETRAPSNWSSFTGCFISEAVAGDSRFWSRLLRRGFVATTRSCVWWFVSASNTASLACCLAKSKARYRRFRSLCAGWAFSLRLVSAKSLPWDHLRSSLVWNQVMIWFRVWPSWFHSLVSETF